MNEEISKLKVEIADLRAELGDAKSTKHDLFTERDELKATLAREREKFDGCQKVVNTLSALVAVGMKGSPRPVIITEGDITEATESIKLVVEELQHNLGFVVARIPLSHADEQPTKGIEPA